MSEQLDPQTFSIDDWLTGARAPQESATIYQRPDIIAELTRLKAEIEEAKAAEELDPARAEVSISELTEAQRLTHEYESLLHEFAESRLTVYLKGITDEEMKEVLEETKVANPDSDHESIDPADPVNVDYGYRLTARCIVGVRRANDTETIPVTFTGAKARELSHRIGLSQWARILEARDLAQHKFPKPDADFLL